ncbi:hypothetical protein AMK16_02430 [Streptomyces sp. CB00455]|uniref:hypothetical protein n=1 Tax=Streptomyces sp. CB00455 TaxID=1703927 RepID=UPI00093C9417|nr:hypothetical protein [Streptomyces sp. CB00455]OKK22092.1 hypothetical protein AMK16_02430 [Streptomyces sp. CB00455]
MRKARWAAAAAGVVLLVAGCGSGGGSDADKAKAGGTVPSGAASAPAKAGASGSLDAAAVKKEIEGAATAAGFTEGAGDEVPAGLKSCMVSWFADGKKATDSKKSYDATVAALAKGGWKELRSADQQVSVIKTLDKSGWSLKASHHGTAGTLLMVSFIATDSSPACEKLFREDLAKNKQ